MPRPRFTTRRLMVLVAAVAVGMGTIAGLGRPRDSCLHEAVRHSKLSDEALKYA